MNWEIIESAPATAKENMRRDQELLENLSDRPILHLYSWIEDSATYGHFIKPEELLDMDGVKKRGLSLAKRPTGGGVIFHLSDLAFSVLVPSSAPAFSVNTLENYAYVNRLVAKALAATLGSNATLLPVEPCSQGASRHFCMAKSTKYDLVVDGRKIGGAAQRRCKQGFLHQGTISIAFPPKEYLQDVLKDDSGVLLAMTANSYCLLPEPWTKSDLEAARKNIRAELVKALSE